MKIVGCVWGSETLEEFESNWVSIITSFERTGNEWFSTRYLIYASWVPTYFMNIPLVGVLRTTSRSESTNSFFNRFIHRKLSFVEFWLRFDTDLGCRCQVDLKADNGYLRTSPKLKTPWAMEKRCSMIYTHVVFKNFNPKLYLLDINVLFGALQKTKRWKLWPWTTNLDKSKWFISISPTCLVCAHINYLSPMVSHAAISYKCLELRSKMRYHWLILWRDGRKCVKDTYIV